MACLTVLEGPVKGQRFFIELPLTRVGRHADNDMVLQDGSVSGTHCEIIRGPDGFTIRDLGSTNGTKVNSEPIKEKQLQRNDVVMVGDVVLMIEGEDVPEQSLGDVQDLPRTTIVIPQKSTQKMPKVFVPRTSGTKIWKSIIILLIIICIGMAVWYFVK